MKITVIFIHTAESISAAVVEAIQPFIEEVTGNLSQINNLLGNLNDTVSGMDEDNMDSEDYICGGTGGWRRVVYLNMTDDNAVCPIGWQDNGHSTRTCGRVSTGRLECDSAFFTVCGGCYTKVCGRITAYQFVFPDAFESYVDGDATTIDSAYVSGVSLTHGTPRQHIWTFACGVNEIERTRSDRDNCPCDSDIAIDTPPFVGEDYFCESGNNQAESNEQFHEDDPLWDGEGCTSISTCCSFNNPPYFTKMLPFPTTDDIEVRLCQFDDRSGIVEDTPIEFMELYVK